MEKVLEGALNLDHLQKLIDDEILCPETIGAGQLTKIREDMERAEMRRLQPHFIESFFFEAFKNLGGKIFKRENRRYEISRVPAKIRDQSVLIGFKEPVATKYRRIVFENSLISEKGTPPAEFVCPGHPLLDSTIEILIKENSELLNQGTILVDENDFGTVPKIVFYLEQSIQDGRLNDQGNRQVISQNILYVELDKK